MLSKERNTPGRMNRIQMHHLIVTFAPAGIEKMFVELDNDMARIKEIGVKYGTEFEI